MDSTKIHGIMEMITYMLKKRFFCIIEKLWKRFQIDWRIPKMKIGKEG